jgi:hypothetical protein
MIIQQSAVDGKGNQLRGVARSFKHFSIFSGKRMGEYLFIIVLKYIYSNHHNI